MGQEGRGHDFGLQCRSCARYFAEQLCFPSVRYSYSWSVDNWGICCPACAGHQAKAGKEDKGKASSHLRPTCCAECGTFCYFINGSFFDDSSVAARRSFACNRLKPC